jgi:predicted alpha-1,6-mannanase (GH76 family)
MLTKALSGGGFARHVKAWDESRSRCATTATRSTTPTIPKPPVSNLINADNLINDGLDSACHNNRRNTWSYNQGVILGGLSVLSKETGDAKMLERAQSIATAAIAKLSDRDGILHDTCEPNCGADGVQFKGIFTRGLGVLNAAAPQARFKEFLTANAESVWRNQDANHKFGVVWSGPSDPKTAATQVSALDALLAAAGAEPAGLRTP